MNKIKVKTKYQLRIIIEDKNIPLETIDISLIKDMAGIFKNMRSINGSISDWDVSHVKDMSYMFKNTEINQDISNWNVSKVENMAGMFEESSFNQDISKWDISSVKKTVRMFRRSEFNHNLGIWDLSNKNTTDMFRYSSYTSEKYESDRNMYLQNKYDEKNKKEIEKSLNENIELDTIEMEF